eukprot:TRINITY_DN593_c0_g1_i3.p1 TRINITY_DN593_c0_g1~~TRINITY_DN593_c0_g1_i3.p1  ORF type:complete len:109 (+),score=8.43 TRINITY_DN593_c0_g1_i3:41-367(+)
MFTFNSNHMLYPQENRESNTLEMVCRACPFREEARNFKIYEHHLTQLEEEKTINWSDIASDVTRPRTSGIDCPNCGYNLVVLLHLKYKDKVKLHFVCAQCCHHWSDKD